jgi:hypothetical protein
MVALEGLHRNPRSATELDGWLAAARDVLAGNEGRDGETNGGKRVMMYYEFSEGIQMGWQERIEDVEVE